MSDPLKHHIIRIKGYRIMCFAKYGVVYDLIYIWRAHHTACKAIVDTFDLKLNARCVVLVPGLACDV